MGVRGIIATISDNLEANREKRERDRAEWRESLRKPVWCERFNGKYDAALYWNSFPADEYGDPWPIHVYEIGTGKVIGTHYIAAPGCHSTNFPRYRRAAEKLISDYERWTSVPEGQEPLRPIEEIA